MKGAEGLNQLDSNVMQRRGGGGGFDIFEDFFGGGGGGGMFGGGGLKKGQSLQLQWQVSLEDI